VLQRKIKAAQDVAETYFRPGAHSSDTTGAEGESSFPRFVVLFGEFFTWKTDKTVMDTLTRDTRRRTYQNVIGAQPPLGEDGQTLRTEVTSSNNGPNQHRATRNLAATPLPNARQVRQRTISPTPSIRRGHSNGNGPSEPSFASMMMMMMQTVSRPPPAPVPTLSSVMEDIRAARQMRSDALREGDAVLLRMADLAMRTADQAMRTASAELARLELLNSQDANGTAVGNDDVGDGIDVNESDGE